MRKAAFCYFLSLAFVLHPSETQGVWPIDLTTAQERVLREVLQQCFHSDDIKEASALKGLSTSTLFRIKLNDQDLVLRVLNPQRSNDLYNSISDEIECMKKMSGQYVAPSLYWTSENDNMILMDYIPHNRISDQDLDDAFYCKLGNTLRDLHQGSLFSCSKTAFESIRDMAANISNLPQLAIDCLSKMETLEKALKSNHYLAPCHRDLNTANILNNSKKIYFIDWEMAANDDPFFDLATVSNFLVFEEGKEDFLLNHHFSSPVNEEQRAHLHLMKIVSLCYYGITILKITNPLEIPIISDDLPNFKTFAFNIRKGLINMKSPTNLIHYGLVMLRDALHQLKSPETLEAITLLS